MNMMICTSCGKVIDGDKTCWIEPQIGDYGRIEIDGYCEIKDYAKDRCCEEYNLVPIFVDMESLMEQIKNDSWGAIDWRVRGQMKPHERLIDYLFGMGYIDCYAKCFHKDIKFEILEMAGLL